MHSHSALFGVHYGQLYLLIAYRRSQGVKLTVYDRMYLTTCGSWLMYHCAHAATYDLIDAECLAGAWAWLNN